VTAASFVNGFERRVNDYSQKLVPRARMRARSLSAFARYEVDTHTRKAYACRP
jgi:hypothetical protein